MGRETLAEKLPKFAERRLLTSQNVNVEVQKRGCIQEIFQEGGKVPQKMLRKRKKHSV